MLRSCDRLGVLRRIEVDSVEVGQSAGVDAAKRRDAVLPAPQRPRGDADGCCRSVLREAGPDSGLAKVIGRHVPTIADMITGSKGRILSVGFGRSVLYGVLG